MRWGKCINTVFVLPGAMLLAGGCAMNSKKHHHADHLKDQPTTMPVIRHYEPSAAGSLVFDPPVTLGQPALELSRDMRTPDAFVAYESTSITYFYLRTDDRQMSDHGDRNDRYDRRAISTKVGISYR